MKCEQKATKERGAIAKTGFLFAESKDDKRSCGTEMVPLGPEGNPLVYLCPACGSHWSRCGACGAMFRNMELHFVKSASCRTADANAPHRNVLARGAKYSKGKT
jgi:predicted RNA-binding Zn-ribbon protein involved in translation (DUF1610 family)